MTPICIRVAESARHAQQIRVIRGQIPFTPQALTFAASKSNLRLIDGDELVDLIYEYYEQFDSRYKGLLPLKRVCAPEVLEEPEE